jgi:hypothetical protein
MSTAVHHEFPDTYADDWEDCLVVGEGFIDNATTAEYWGGPAGATIVSLHDCTDGPRTRVRFVTDDPIPVKETFPEGSRFRLRPNDAGLFVVTEYEAGMGPFDCVIMRAPDITLANSASVEKWVPREMKETLFPIGRRFDLTSLGEAGGEA